MLAKKETRGTQKCNKIKKGLVTGHFNSNIMATKMLLLMCLEKFIVLKIVRNDLILLLLGANNVIKFF